VDRDRALGDAGTIIDRLSATGLVTS
jgi:hypothetical protein